MDRDECLAALGLTLQERSRLWSLLAAVLLLGFAGSEVPLEGASTAKVLGPLVRWYEQTLGWRVVATTGCGFCTDALAGGAAGDAQIDRVVQALAGTKKIVVHAMSNNGVDFTIL